MGEGRGRATSGRQEPPPSPGQVRTLDELAARLRELRAWAGNPSFTRVVKDVAARRAARGVPASEQPGRVTVYEVFREGRKRVDVELLVDIVAVLGVDDVEQEAWRRAHRAASAPPATVPRSVRSAAVTRVGDALLDALDGGGPRRIANLTGPAGSGRSAVLAALPVDAVLVDLAVDDSDDVLRAALDDAPDLVIIDNADSPAAIAAVGAALDRRANARAVVASRRPLPGSPGTPGTLAPDIVVVPVVARSSGDAAEHRAVRRAPGRPAELPPGISEFTGRDRELAQLTRALGAPAAADSVAVCVISGMSGIGKTTLAVHAAHHLASAYPDGQLFADLTDAQPGEVLARFLTGLGVDRSVVPHTVNERLAMYRSRTAGRRVLVVLDNAASESVVRPLVPGAASCGVLVTSRSRLSALSSVARVDLGQLSEAEGVSLMRAVAGTGARDRDGDGDGDWDDESARAVVRLCDRLPLAIRIAAARLARRRDVPLARFAGRLADEKARLDLLSTGDVGVRACFDLACADLGEPARRSFLFFGLLGLDSVASWVLAVATGLPPVEVELAVDELVDAQLFTTAGPDATGEPRYGTHDLVRLYAVERATADLAEDERGAGVRRVLESWLAVALAADRGLPYRTLPDPEPGDRHALPAASSGFLADPVAWFTAERDQLRAVVVLAIEAGRQDIAWRFADACAGFYEACDHYDDWRETHLACLRACDPTGAGAFTMARNLAYQYSLPVVRGTLMAEHARRALDISERTGRAHGAAQARVLLAVAAFAQASFDEAFDLATAARERVAPGSQVDLAALSVLGVLCRLRGDLDKAAAYFTDLLRHVGNHRHNGYELVATRTLAIIRRAEGRYEEAVEILVNGVRLTRELGVRGNELLMLIELGETLALAGMPAAADQLTDALRLAESMSSEIGAALTWRAMATVDIARGDLDTALERLTRSLSVQQRHGIPHVEAHTLRTLGEVQARLGDQAAAARSWRHARTIYTVLGNKTEINTINRDLTTLGENPES